MSQQNSENKSPNRISEPVDNVVIETNDGFEIDWDSIENNVKKSESRRKHRHHRHHKHHRHSAKDSSSSSGGTKIKNAVNIVENNQKGIKYYALKTAKIVLLVLLLIILLVMISFFILRYIGEQELFNYGNLNIETIDEAHSTDNGQTIVYNDKTYTFNPYVTSILFMGVDKESLDLGTDIVGNAGQADAIYLVTYDASTGDLKVISFSRDILVDINTYDTNGKYAGVETAQLCLSYAYGDGKEKSAQNVVSSLQRIIYNIPINSYFAMDLNAISVVNDDIGGVTLTSLLTFGDFVEGQKVTLTGDQTETYLRYRDVNVLDSNTGRMARQQQYLTSFANQLVPSIRKDITLPLTLYNHANDYVFTNLSPSKITYLASSVASSYKGIEFISIPGEIIASEIDGKAQFIPDRIKLYEILLDTFYNESN